MTAPATGAADVPGTLRDGGSSLDLVRFVAATLVLVSHSYTLTGRGGEPALFQYETLGGLAVAVFFVISGFLVTSSWHRAPRLGAFVRKRALRIMPALVVVVTLSALVLGPLLSPLPLRDYLSHPQTRDYFLNLTFTQLNYSLPLVFAGNPHPHAVNGSLWTLPIEVAMYALLASLGALGVLRRSVVTVLLVALAVAGLGLGPGIIERAAPHFPDVLPPVACARLATWFFTGSLLWLWRDRVPLKGSAAAAMLGMAWVLQGSTPGLLVLHLAVPYAVLWVGQLRLPALAAFGRHGDFSYGMYLYAFPVQQTFANFGAASWPLPVYVGACFVVTLGCAVLSWRLVEAPALRLKHARGSAAAPHMMDGVRQTGTS